MCCAAQPPQSAEIGAERLRALGAGGQDLDEASALALGDDEHALARQRAGRDRSIARRGPRRDR